MITAPEYSWVSNMEYGIYRYFDGGKFGIANRQGTIVDSKYNAVSAFKGQFAELISTGKTAIINQRGEVILELDDRIHVFPDAIAYDDKDLGYWRVFVNDQWVNMHKSVKKVESIKHGVMVCRSQNGSYGLFNYKVKLQMHGKYQGLALINKDYLLVSAGQKRRVINLKKKIISEFKCESFEISENGYISYQINKKWGLMSPKAKVIKEPFSDRKIIFDKFGLAKIITADEVYYIRTDGSRLGE